MSPPTLSGPIPRHEIPDPIVFAAGLAATLGCVALLIILAIGH